VRRRSAFRIAVLGGIRQRPSCSAWFNSWSMSWSLQWVMSYRLLLGSKNVSAGTCRSADQKLTKI
jgi:hypothetical protein